MKNGLYKCEVKKDYAELPAPLCVGEIILFVKDTKNTLSLKLISNTVKYDAPQIDDMFFGWETVNISKRGSKHSYVDFRDNSFTLYPYRLGVPYYFEFAEETE